MAPVDSSADPPERSGLKVALLLGVVAIALGVAGWFLLDLSSLPGTAGLHHELRDRGRVAVVGDDELARLEADGSQLIPSSEVSGLDEVLAGTDEAALTELLQREGIGAILVDGRIGGRLEEGASLGDRLRAYGNLETLRGVYLTPTAALYERRRGLLLEPPLGDALARAARQIVGGSPLPRIRSFPEPLRRTRNVEVMVMLESGGTPRLWRSARGGSIARALVTAASVARQRWNEREQAMGGPIDERLPRMTVRVFLLEEDGTLAERGRPFVERVFTTEHGVALEQRGSWHYLLPAATRDRGEGSAMAAYRALFEDAGLASAGAASDGGAMDEEGADATPRDFERSFTRSDIRLYRLVARELGTSGPAVSTGSPVPSLGPGLDGALLPPGALDGLDDVFEALAAEEP